MPASTPVAFSALSALKGHSRVLTTASAKIRACSITKQLNQYHGSSLGRVTHRTNQHLKHLNSSLPTLPISQQFPGLRHKSTFPPPHDQSFAFSLSPVYPDTDPYEHDFPDFGDYSIILPPDPPSSTTDLQNDGAQLLHKQNSKPKAWREVPKEISRPNYVGMSKEELSIPYLQKRIGFGGEEERKLRAAAELAKRVREYAASLVKVGITTDGIDKRIHAFIISNGAYPSPLGYLDFPKSCCTSVNNIIAHGIPDERPLENGDIINVDVTVYLNGYHGDTSQTFLVGDVDAPGCSLVNITNQALEAGIRVCGPGQHFREIGNAIDGVIKDLDYSVSSQFTGHGIGDVFHRPPWILHHPNSEPEVMQPGDCFTIEPCIVQGPNPRGWMFADGWTVSTINCARSAQAEHMVLITETGYEVLTA